MEKDAVRVSIETLDGTAFEGVEEGYKVSDYKGAIIMGNKGEGLELIAIGWMDMKKVAGAIAGMIPNDKRPAFVAHFLAAIQKEPFPNLEAQIRREE